MIEECALCQELEKGDTLYKSNDWDGGIGFDYIRDIQYCPICGKALTTWKERRRAVRSETGQITYTEETREDIPEGYTVAENDEDMPF